MSSIPKKDPICLANPTRIKWALRRAGMDTKHSAAIEYISHARVLCGLAEINLVMLWAGDPTKAECLRARLDGWKTRRRFK